MIDVLLSDTGILIYELLAILIMAVFIVKLSKEKHSRSRNAAVQKQRQQHDALDQELVNSKGNHR